MKGLLNKITALGMVVGLLCISQQAAAYVTIAGNGTYPGTANGTTFSLGNNGINTGHTYFPLSEAYLGLFPNNGTYAVCYGSLRSTDHSLIPLATDPALTDQYIRALSPVQNSSDLDAPTIVALVNNATVLQAITKTHTAAVQSPVFNDPAGNPNGALVYAHCAYDVTPSAANVTIVPLKVQGGTLATPFGAGVAGTTGVKTDGISAAYITQTSAGVPVWNYVGANGATNVATAFDLTATGSFLISDGATPLTSVGATHFHVDAPFQRFYVTVEGTVAANVGRTNGLYGVGIYPFSTSGQTVTVGNQLAPCASTAPVTVANSIIGYSQNGATTVSAAGDIAVMHTSTGMGYLIISGAVIASDTVANAQQAVANQIYAIPLVNGDPNVNPNVGCFANVHSGDRTLIATVAGDLITTASPAALVGGTGILPVTNSLLNGQPAPNFLNLISCDGDTVYAATGGSNPASSINEPGFWMSQAVFNELGQIDHWTDWQKAAPNDMGGQSGNGVASDGSDPRVDFAAIDGYTGYIATYNSVSLKVNLTQWSKPTTATPNSLPYLASAVNNALNDTCYSVLDLNASTTGWGSATPMRMTLFGGEEKVCFAITGSRGITAITANGTYTTINNSFADTLYDFTNTATFYTSSLPAGAGAVVSLGWSGWDPNTTTGATTGFFFAGCAGTATVAPGLYIYTPSGTLAGAGFNPVTLGASAAVGGSGAGAMVDLGLVTSAGAPGTGKWNLVTSVTGMPVKIQSMGGGLHVLARTGTVDRLYSAAAQATGSGVVNGFVVTAVSATDNLATARQIYDFVVSVSATPAVAGATPATGYEQLLLLTSDGIYTSSSSIGMQAANSGNLNQTSAGWQVIDSTSPVITRMFFTDYIQVPAYTRDPQTFWFSNFVSNPALGAVYNNNTSYQMLRQGFLTAAPTLTNAITYAKLPTPNYNGTMSFVPTTATSYKNFPVLARCFYDDGIRRYFVQKNPDNDRKYQVVVLPYNLYNYNVGTSGKPPMQEAVVAEADQFYWMSLIGDTGCLMMSTSNGLLVLQ